MSTELETIRRWYEYNSFARKRYLNTIFGKVPARVRYQPSGASFPTMVDIFVHVLDAYRWWFVYVYENRLPDYERHARKRHTKREVVKEENEVDLLVTSFIEHLDEQDIDRVLRYRDGRIVKTIRVGDMLHHMIEEELQHRGEINALLWQLEIDPPIVGFHEWVRKAQR